MVEEELGRSLSTIDYHDRTKCWSDWKRGWTERSSARRRRSSFDWREWSGFDTVLAGWTRPRIDSVHRLVETMISFRRVDRTDEWTMMTSDYLKGYVTGDYRSTRWIHNDILPLWLLSNRSWMTWRTVLHFLSVSFPYPCRSILFRRVHLSQTNS